MVLVPSVAILILFISEPGPGWAGEAITTHYSLFLKADHLAMGRGTEMMSVVIITSRGGYHRHQQPHVDTGTMGRI